MESVECKKKNSSTHARITDIAFYLPQVNLNLFLVSHRYISPVLPLESPSFLNISHNPQIMKLLLVSFGLTLISVECFKPTTFAAPRHSRSCCSGCPICSPTTLAAVYGEPRPVQIIPSVLPADFGKLGADCKALEDAGCDRIQFDVMDGNFVPNLTFGPDTIRWCRQVRSDEERSDELTTQSQVTKPTRARTRYNSTVTIAIIPTPFAIRFAPCSTRPCPSRPSSWSRKNAQMPCYLR